MKQSRVKNYPLAFSLIEVLFAVMLLSVVLFGVIRLEISQFRLSETQKNEIRGYSIAHQNIEKVLALGRVELDAKCNAEACQCQLNQGALSCGEAAQETIGIFTQYFLLNNAKLKNAWQVSSVVEWEDSTGVHSGENGGGAVVKRIVY